MKRIILIGNGFDLAHGMKTSYKNFVDDLWARLIADIKQSGSGQYTDDLIKIIRVPQIWNSGNTYNTLINGLKQYNQTVSFQNKFLQIITHKNNIQTWVDIENEYYFLLKESYRNPNAKIMIDQLNSNFEKIKNCLEEYLNEIERNFNLSDRNQDFSSRIKDIIYSNFKLKDFCEDSINSKVNVEYDKIIKDIKALDENQIGMEELNLNNQVLIARIGSENPKKDIRELLLSEDASLYFDLKPSEVLFLNFNYTSTEDIYKNHPIIPTKSIHIHGSLRPSDENPIIFGFGDEIDEDYKAIENLNNNKYLENIKSIKYLETDNYKDLLEYLNTGSYQIFLFGHSCGISDRTLLNTLFEHKNCVSIKPYYYQISDDKDNYSDIVRNISRNFNNKIVMRDKVVNKKYCEPLS